MNETKHRARLWLFAALTLLMMIVIFWFSAQNAVVSQQMSDGFLASLIGRFLDAFLPRLSEKGMQFDIRKYAHMSEFFVLAVCAFLYASASACFTHAPTRCIRSLCPAGPAA